MGAAKLRRQIRRRLNWLVRIIRGSGGYWRRREPVSRLFGFDRGTPIDRHYIEQFLRAHASDIHGRVLEISDSTYTRRFGGANVTHADVLHFQPGNPVATIVADLTVSEGLPIETFDCVILTQTLPFIFDPASAVRNCRRMLKPKGVLLVTVSGISQISRYDMDRWGDYWRFTDRSLQAMLDDVFSSESVTVRSFGNVKSASSLLYGLAAEEVPEADLQYDDHDYQVIIGGRAQR